MADNLERHYDHAGEYWGIDPNVLRAVHLVEDPSGDPKAQSRAGAIGHMQFMPKTAEAIGIDPRDPVQSIYGAARILRENLDHYGNLPDALKAYNAGTDQSKWGNSETMAYPQKVAAQYVGLQQPNTHPPSGTDTGTATQSQGMHQDTDEGASAFDSIFGDAGEKKSAAPDAGNVDPFDATFGHVASDDALPAKATAHQGTWLGNLAEFGRNVDEAAQNQFHRGTLFVASKIPGLSHALAGTNLDLDARRAEADAQDKQIAEQHPYAVPTGKALADTEAGIMGALIANPLIAAAGGEAASALGGTAGRALQAGTNLLVGNGGLRTRMASGAIQGGAIAAMQGENPLWGAGIGAIGVPALEGAGAALGYAGNTAKRMGASTLNRLIPKEADNIASDVGRASSAENSGVPPEGANNAAPAAAASQAAPNGAGNSTQVPPEAIRLGLFSKPQDAEKLAQTILEDARKGGPVQLVRSKIPGVNFTASQATGNPGIALIERQRRAANPNLFTALEQQNSAARNAYAQNIIGTPEQLEAAEAAREAAENMYREAAFKDEQPVDVTPIRQHLARLIDDNAGRDTVQQPLINVLKSVNAVTDKDGMAMPGKLWNVRKFMGDMVAPRARGTASDGQAAASQLLDLKPTVTDAINSGAPGFDHYLQKYEELSRPIDAMRHLQGANLTNANGDVMLQRLDTFLKTMRRERGKPGVRPSDSVTDEQIQALENLRDDFRLEARKDLGKARGSDTNVNLFTNSKMLDMAQGAAAKMAGAAGVGLGGALTAGWDSGIISGFAGKSLAEAAARRTAARAAITKDKTLNYLDNMLANPYPKN